AKEIQLETEGQFGFSEHRWQGEQLCQSIANARGFGAEDSIGVQQLLPRGSHNRSICIFKRSESVLAHGKGFAGFTQGYSIQSVRGERPPLPSFDPGEFDGRNDTAETQ